MTPLKTNYFYSFRIQLFFTILYLFPACLLAGDTIPENMLEEALRIEYNLVIPRYDSLVDYSLVPYKKILTMRKKEVLQEFFFLGQSESNVFYHDLEDGWVYQEVRGAPVDSVFIKNKWEKKGSVIEVSKNAIKTIAGKPCKAYRCEISGDTSLFYSTTALGVEFNDFVGMEGISLEGEFMAENRIRLKYRAMKIDTVFLPPKDLFNRGAAKLLNLQKPSDAQMIARQKSIDYAKRLEQKMLGSKAPFFKIKTLAGEKINSKKLQGKILVLNFWFTTCRPCIKEIPALNKVRELYDGDEEVVFISLCKDGWREIQSILYQISFDYEICPDARYVAERFRLLGYPLNVVINREGRIIKYTDGYRMDIGRQLVDAIELAKTQ